MLATVAVVMAAALALRFVAFEPRWTPLFWTWAALNLLTTCVSEEAFFRGLVQTELRRAIPSRHAAGAAIGISALLFGLAHVAGGWRYAMLAALAGTGYGLAYERTSRLEMAILTHVTLNVVHFLLFTYPALR
jgi:membrane protease YdiL (CAAX protease family)